MIRPQAEALRLGQLLQVAQPGAWVGPIVNPSHSASDLFDASVYPAAHNPSNDASVAIECPLLDRGFPPHAGF